MRPVPQVCKDFLKEQEGCVLHKYKDTAGRWTIGIGHLIKPGENIRDTITLGEAYALLEVDLLSAAGEVDRSVTVALNDNEFSALISFTFNEGVTAFHNSTLRTLLNAGNRAAAAEQFLRWNKVRNPATGELEPSEALRNRRLREQQLFLKGVR